MLVITENHITHFSFLSRILARKRPRKKLGKVVKKSDISYTSIFCYGYLFLNAVADLRGGGRRGRAPPPLGTELSLISCSFWEILTK